MIRPWPIHSATEEPPPDLPAETCECGDDLDDHDKDGAESEEGDILSPCERCECKNFKGRQPNEPEYSREQDDA